MTVARSDSVATRLATVEARWFAHGDLPQDVAAWFSTGGAVAAEPARTDRYLRLPGVSDVGVKLREQRLEIKARRGEPLGRVAWARSPTPLERWLKWSVPLAALPTDREAPVDVVKARRILAWGDAAVELAEIGVGTRRAWSFGIEAPTVCALEAVLASRWAGAAPACAVAFVGGYPAWLEHFGAAG